MIGCSIFEIAMSCEKKCRVTMKIHKSLSLFVSMNKVVNKDGCTCTNECIFIDHLGESADRGWSMGKSINFSHMGPIMPITMIRVLQEWYSHNHNIHIMYYIVSFIISGFQY